MRSTISTGQPQKAKAREAGVQEGRATSNSTKWDYSQTPGLYRIAADVGLLAFHPHFLCGWHGFDLLETAVLAAGKIQCLLLILAAVGSVTEG
ncbi:hypothetical protein Nepgr_031318 [Nepenthes gracilis]|uniref:Uncharacterized protein n=1 Tax=Nepenthes gracilis TaxID=150966 RepID=A0AAD3Y6P9_NEPGR|nr:hypothetical protein Nepgr_031318 [Nepenthes gracilis]